jgi:hypothetical protein
LKVRWTNGIEYEWRNTTEGNNKWLFKWESWDTWRVWLRFSRWEVSAFRTKRWLIRSIKLLIIACLFSRSLLFNVLE